MVADALAEDAATRYAAFISYSHVDQATARWLHRALEGYRVPRRVLRRGGGELPRRLAPVFLDREELSSSANLGEAVRRALQRSAALIVICSPDAAASRWVNEEIRYFKALGREHHVLCLIVAGEPLAGERGLPAATECFPPALRHAVADGQVTATRAGEPLAADMRHGADNRRGALLRLVAGLLHVDLDLLRQREHARWQRRLALVGAAAIVACSVFAALALAAWLARGEAERQRQFAEQKSLTARRTADFLVSLFRVADPSEARGNSITAREILDRGARQIDSSLRGEPAVRAELSTTLGEVYRGLGLYGPALDLLSKSRAIDAQDPDGWVRATLSLAELEMQRGNDARSNSLFAEAAERYARLGGADPQVRAQLLLGRGGAAAVLQHSAEAQSYFEQALVLGRTSGLAGVQVEALEGLAMNHFYAGEFAAAERDYQRALEARIAVSGETHPKVSESLNGLAATAYMRGDAARAEAYWQRVLRIDRRLLGPRHPDLAATMNNLGRLWLERRDYARAVAMLTDAVAILSAQQSATHEDLMYAYSNLALAYMGRGADREARPLLQRALAVAQANDHALQGPIIAYQADLDCRDGRYRHGLQRAARARPLIEARYASERWRAAQLRSIEGRCLAGLQRVSEAVRLVDAGTPEVLARWPADTAFGHDAVARALYVYGLAAEHGKLAYHQAQESAQDSPAASPDAKIR